MHAGWHQMSKFQRALSPSLSHPSYSCPLVGFRPVFARFDFPAGSCSPPPCFLPCGTMPFNAMHTIMNGVGDDESMMCNVRTWVNLPCSDSCASSWGPVHARLDNILNTENEMVRRMCGWPDAWDRRLRLTKHHGSIRPAVGLARPRRDC